MAPTGVGLRRTHDFVIDNTLALRNTVEAYCHSATAEHNGTHIGRF